MEKTKIEYCDSTLNPITGCLRGCNYCYARRTAERFKGCDASPDGTTEEEIVYLKERQMYTSKDGRQLAASYPYGFTPTFHEYRLNDPQSKKLGETVFVGSTADCFGPWVPDEWIIKIFDACKAAPGHRWLFLTKYPERYIDLYEKGILPEEDNFWFGSTMTHPGMNVFYSDRHNTFISIEPILAPFRDGENFELLEYTDWVILGAETGPQANKTMPLCSWFEDLVNDFRAKGKPVFMKDSLKPFWGDDIITELPWKPR